MKFLDKMGLAIFSIIVLILSILLCLMGFGWIQPTIFSVLISKVLQNQNSTYIMIGVSVFLVLLSVKCLFFSSNGSSSEEDDDSGILMQNDDGKLLITRDTIESMAEGVMKEFTNINSSDINVIITKENDVIIHAAIDVRKGTIIKDITSKLQARIKEVVKKATDLDIKSVDVKVRHVEAEEAEGKVEDK